MNKLRILVMTAIAVLVVGTSIALPPALAQTVVSTGSQVAIVATPATQEAVQSQAWWAGLADQAITALASFAVIALGVGLNFLRTFVASKSKFAAAAYDKLLADKLHDGAVAIINGEAEKLKQALGAKTAGVGSELVTGAPAEPATRAAIVAAAQPKLEAIFKETLDHFGKTGSQVTDYLQARVEPALAKPAVAIPGVMARS